MTTTHQPSAPGAVDEEQASAYWEPCTFKPGDRVRINTIGGECQFRPEEDTPQHRAGVIGHAAFEHGMTGTVTEWRPWWGEIRQGHRFMVLWDEPLPDAAHDANCAEYAAIELELLAPAVDASAGEGDKG